MSLVYIVPVNFSHLFRVNVKPRASERNALREARRILDAGLQGPVAARRRGHTARYERACSDTVSLDVVYRDRFARTREAASWRLRFGMSVTFVLYNSVQEKIA